MRTFCEIKIVISCFIEKKKNSTFFLEDKNNIHHFAGGLKLLKLLLHLRTVNMFTVSQKILRFMSIGQSGNRKNDSVTQSCVYQKSIKTERYGNLEIYLL
jgi:hypothetical protein